MLKPLEPIAHLLGWSSNHLEAIAQEEPDSLPEGIDHNLWQYDSFMGTLTDEIGRRIKTNNPDYVWRERLIRLIGQVFGIEGEIFARQDPYKPAQFFNTLPTKRDLGESGVMSNEATTRPDEIEITYLAEKILKELNLKNLSPDAIRWRFFTTLPAFLKAHVRVRAGGEFKYINLFPYEQSYYGKLPKFRIAQLTKHGKIIDWGIQERGLDFSHYYFINNEWYLESSLE